MCSGVALLAGKWNDVSPADREVVAKLARSPYEEVTRTLVHWANEPDPPVLRVGDTWLLASKEDAWVLLSRFVTRDDLDLFESVAVEVVGGADPSFDMPADRRWMANVLVSPCRTRACCAKGWRRRWPSWPRGASRPLGGRRVRPGARGENRLAVTQQGQ